MSKRKAKKRQRQLERMTHTEKVAAANKEMMAARRAVQAAERRLLRAVTRLDDLYRAGSHVEIDLAGADEGTVEVMNPKTGEMHSVSIEKVLGDSPEAKQLDEMLDAGLVDEQGKPNAPCVHGASPGQPCPHCENRRLQQEARDRMDGEQTVADVKAMMAEVAEAAEGE